MMPHGHVFMLLIHLVRQLFNLDEKGLYIGVIMQLLLTGPATFAIQQPNRNMSPVAHLTTACNKVINLYTMFMRPYAPEHEAL